MIAVTLSGCSELDRIGIKARLGGIDSQIELARRIIARLWVFRASGTSSSRMLHAVTIVCRGLRMSWDTTATISSRARTAACAAW